MTGERHVALDARQESMSLKLIDNPMRSDGSPWLIIQGTRAGAQKRMWEKWAQDEKNVCQLIQDEGESEVG